MSVDLMDSERWLTTQQAADRLGVSRQLVAQWIKDGRIRATWSSLAHRWLIRADDARKPEPQRPGRPRTSDTS